MNVIFLVLVNISGRIGETLKKIDVIVGKNSERPFLASPAVSASR